MPRPKWTSGRSQDQAIAPNVHLFHVTPTATRPRLVVADGSGRGEVRTGRRQHAVIASTCRRECPPAGSRTTTIRSNVVIRAAIPRTGNSTPASVSEETGFRARATSVRSRVALRTGPGPDTAPPVQVEQARHARPGTHRKGRLPDQAEARPPGKTLPLTSHSGPRLNPAPTQSAPDRCGKYRTRPGPAARASTRRQSPSSPRRSPTMPCRPAKAVTTHITDRRSFDIGPSIT